VAHACSSFLPDMPPFTLWPLLFWDPVIPSGTWNPSQWLYPSSVTGTRRVSSLQVFVSLVNFPMLFWMEVLLGLLVEQMEWLCRSHIRNQSNNPVFPTFWISSRPAREVLTSKVIKWRPSLFQVSVSQSSKLFHPHLAASSHILNSKSLVSVPTE
jgi:hypothetical protein